MAVMKLAGGKTVEVYHNRKCRVCKAKVFQTVCCRKEKANICQEHCRKCEHYLDFMQRCIYREKTEEPEEDNKKKKKNKTAQRRTLSGSAVAPNHYMNYK